MRERVTSINVGDGGNWIVNLRRGGAGILRAQGREAGSGSSIQLAGERE